MARVYLLLGTNLGDRESNLNQAHALLEEAFGPVRASSSTQATEAVGFDGPEFLNRVEAYSTRKSPLTVLKACKEIERKMGRCELPQYRPDGSRIYHSRIIDIDILEILPKADSPKSLEINTGELTVPHPQVSGRAFVAPLLQEAKTQKIK